jgi:hypothetical protein
MRHLPNIICLLRIVLIWPILLSLQSGAYERTLWLFALAACQRRAGRVLGQALWLDQPARRAARSCGRQIAAGVGVFAGHLAGADSVVAGHVAVAGT